ncbi:unnamed protein product, partial [Polarella glacialis]
APRDTASLPATPALRCRPPVPGTRGLREDDAGRLGVLGVAQRHRLDSGTTSRGGCCFLTRGALALPWPWASSPCKATPRQGWSTAGGCEPRSLRRRADCFRSGCFGRGWLQAADPPRHSRPCAVTAAGGRLSPRAAEQSCRSGRRVLPGRRLRERCPSHRRRGRFAAAAPGLRRRDVAGRQTTVP